MVVQGDIVLATFGTNHPASFSTQPRDTDGHSIIQPSLENRGKTRDESAAAIVSNDIYMDPTSKTIANVTVSWEREMANKIQMMQTIKARSSRAPFMVGVVGIPGSGKSTSSEILASMLSNSVVMPMDGYHYKLSQLEKFPVSANVMYRRGAPDTFDPISLQKDLKRIVHGDESNVSIPGFDHARGDPEENKHTFVRDQDKIVVCEGIYLMHQGHGWNEIKSFFDWIIYIDADIDKCIDRLKARNKCIPGYTAEEIDIRCDAVDRVNAQTVEQSRHFAYDVVMSSLQ